MQPEWIALFVSRRHLARVVSDLLLLALAMLGDGWILVRIARTTGVYLALALEGIVAVAALVIVGSSVLRQIREIRAAARAGFFRARQYANLAASIVAGLLLLLPGFATDLIGLLVYLPPGRQIFRWVFLRRQAERLPQVYEYVKLSVFSADDAPADDVPGAPAR